MLFGIQLFVMLVALVCSALVSIRGVESFSIRTLYWILAIAVMAAGAAINLLINGVPK